MRKVLVVEDDASVRDAICELLRAEGFFVIAARDGEEAIARLGTAGELPDAILLDLVMPGMNGWQLRMWLRRDPEYARIPVVLLSAVEDMPREARALGVETFLSKPVDADKLVEALGAKAA